MILHLTAGPGRERSFSRRVSAEMVARLPDAEVILRDLEADPLPHPDAAFAAAVRDGSPADAPAFALSERLVAELEAAETIVIGTPVHNYGLPSALKAWFDQVVRIRRTFRSTPEGKRGMLADRRVIIVVGSGGYFTRGAVRQPDCFTPHITALFATMGIHDLAFLRLEGLGRGEAAIEAALEGAQAWMAAHLS